MVSRKTCRPAPRHGSARGGRGARARDGGLTLVELMITLVISMMVASGMFVFFAGQRRVYEAQMKVLGTQQNLWSVMEALTRVVRAAGTGMTGCVNATDPPPAGATAPATGFRAYRSGAVVRLAPLWIQNGVAGAPDALTAVYSVGSFGNFTDVGLAATVNSNIDNLFIAPALSATVRTGEFVALVNNLVAPLGPPTGDRGCTLFQITGVDPTTGNLLHASTSIWNAAGAVAGLVPFPYVGGAAANAGLRDEGQIVWTRFSIDNTGPSPRLMMNRLDGAAGPQVLAEGIEDLQIAYACDLLPALPGPDGVFSEGLTAAAKLADEWTFNVAGDAVPAGCVRPQAVRLTIVARTTEPDGNLQNLAANAKPAAEDGVAGAHDTFRHRVLTTTVYPRNR